jgi:predicted GNAT superfamily acetyltransferase
MPKRSKIKYRVVTDPNEMKELVPLQAAIWSMPVNEAVPHNMLHAVVHVGGVIIRADDGDQLVGFAMAMVGWLNNEGILWSHMAGVIPSYQGRGIGFALKQEQRKWALKRKYKTIAWTFDPMQRGNANFNLHLLKTVSSTYHVNFYGEMTDGINAGMPSDRLEATWNLLAEPVVVAAKGSAPAPPTTDYPQEDFLLYSDADGQPHTRQLSALTARWYFAEIPYHLAALKSENIQRAKEWQLMLREVLSAAFAQGYVAVGFVEDGGRCWYVLEKSAKPRKKS